MAYRDGCQAKSGSRQQALLSRSQLILQWKSLAAVQSGAVPSTLPCLMPDRSAQPLPCPPQRSCPTSHSLGVIPSKPADCCTAAVLWGILNRMNVMASAATPWPDGDEDVRDQWDATMGLMGRRVGQRRYFIWGYPALLAVRCTQWRAVVLLSTAAPGSYVVLFSLSLSLDLKNCHLSLAALI